VKSYSPRVQPIANYCDYTRVNKQHIHENDIMTDR